MNLCVSYGTPGYITTYGYSSNVAEVCNAIIHFPHKWLFCHVVYSYLFRGLPLAMADDFNMKVIHLCKRKTTEEITRQRGRRLRDFASLCTESRLTCSRHATWEKSDLEPRSWSCWRALIRQRSHGIMSSKSYTNVYLMDVYLKL